MYLSTYTVPPCISRVTFFWLLWRIFGFNRIFRELGGRNCGYGNCLRSAKAAQVKAFDRREVKINDFGSEIEDFYAEKSLTDGKTQRCNKANQERKATIKKIRAVVERPAFTSRCLFCCIFVFTPQDAPTRHYGTFFVSFLPLE